MTTLIAKFCCFENEFQKSCVLYRNFISIYKINRKLHGRLGIRILSSRAESISHLFALLTRERYFQHFSALPKIKFVSPGGHVISSMNFTLLGIVITQGRRQCFQNYHFLNLKKISSDFLNSTRNHEIPGLWHKGSKSCATSLSALVYIFLPASRSRGNHVFTSLKISG